MIKKICLFVLFLLLDFTNRIMGKWCLNKEIDMLLNDAKTTFKLLEDKINILIEEKI
jgi:hypothetical protein